MTVKLSKMKKLVINVPIFDTKVTVIISNDIENITSYIESIHDIPWQSIHVDGITCQIDNEVIIGLKESCDNRVIVHEVCHAVFALNRILGLEFAEETWCYLSDYLYNTITKFIHD